MTDGLCRLRRLIAAGVVGFLAFGFAAEADAHASLVSAQPRDGAMLAAPPAKLVLVFNEPVTPLTFRLIATDGGPVELTADAVGETVTLTPSAAVGAGTHVLSWRVVSADGHPVGGALLFDVEHKSASAPNLVGAETGLPVRAGIWLARLAIYAGLFVGVGGAFFMAWSPAPPPRAARITCAIALGIALAAILLSVGLQGLDALAAPLGRLLDPAVWRNGYRTSYGDTALFAAVAVALGAGALMSRRPALQRLTALVALGALSLAFAASGHASVAPPQGLMRPAVFIHVAAVTLWAGSLVPLLALLRGRQSIGRALSRFSRAIPAVLVALLVTGVILAVVQIGRIGALWETSYGIVFLFKSAAVIALGALAAANRFLLTPAVSHGRAAARVRLAASIKAESALVLVIFGLVALWRFTPPPRSIVLREPAFLHIHTDRAMAEVTVTPGQAGPVEVGVQLLREDFTPLPARQVTLRFSSAGQGIGPLSREAAPAGDGIWRVDGLSLPVGGTWTVEVEVLVDDFNRIALDAPIVIAPSSR